MSPTRSRWGALGAALGIAAAAVAILLIQTPEFGPPAVPSAPITETTTVPMQPPPPPILLPEPNMPVPCMGWTSAGECGSAGHG